MLGLVLLAGAGGVAWAWKSGRLGVDPARRLGALTAAGRRRRRQAAMDDREARAILGVKAGADADAIRAAHRRLIVQAHPDAGGSAEWALRVNVARDRLLARLAKG